MDGLAGEASGSPQGQLISLVLGLRALWFSRSQRGAPHSVRFPASIRAELGTALNLLKERAIFEDQWGHPAPCVKPIIA
jgi:hypothetical protein